ncbi:cytochrome o ubiquinol oxidase subunit IV [Paracoccus sp. S3-43]|uniref:cytochrome o ubiquinol oxidase subunit IV n=1 Tax=Paracoccus sp. S3-43 TaxID=3030011 RepID=UPI0023B0EDD5|nr:cytochrome o ubiquinol oxidase subunit IV [Paracoccus sp. S3-43]WEF23923.1 cytochrome o ubiquinol oxidase subunit IV [Paracoccus sp. S3-43]
MPSIEAQGDKHRATRHGERHGDHHDDGHDHGSVRSYLTGFVLSAILTAIPFAVVMGGGFESRLLTAAVVVGLAFVQIVVHMVYFLHMNGRSDEGWTMMALIFTVVILVIVLAGSLWVMYHMNVNMMPQMDHEASGLGS